MARYGDSDYDPDYDDSPPPSPQLKAFRNASPPSIFRRTSLRLRRLRGLIIVILLTTSVFYLLAQLRRRGPLFAPKHEPSLKYKNVNWKHYAYSQYATDSDHLCNALMIFEALHRYGSKAERVLMYPETMDTMISDIRDRDSQLLVKARDEFGVKLMPMAIPHIVRNTTAFNPAPYTDPSTSKWDQSLTKLNAFNLTQYLRVIHLDNDLTLNTHLDTLFLLPSTPIAMTRAYWNPPSSSEPLLSPHLLILEPSSTEAARLDATIATLSTNPVYTTSIADLALNTLYASSALVLPHTTYALRTSQLRLSPDPSSPLHSPFLGYDPSTYPPPSLDPVYNSQTPNLALWDPRRALRHAALIHFAGDEPLPKPWVLWPQNLLAEIRPKCREEHWDVDKSKMIEEGCENREVWMGLYEDFRKRRKAVCGLLSVPAPIYIDGKGKKGGKAEEEGKARKEGGLVGERGDKAEREGRGRMMGSGTEGGGVEREGGKVVL